MRRPKKKDAVVWMLAIILSDATVSSLVAYKLDELKAL